jgi:hypothetical protein
MDIGRNMLNKNICKTCINAIGSSMSDGWSDDSDDSLWEQGYVLCPKTELNYEGPVESSVFSEPPKDCPYVLEHMLSREELDNLAEFITPKNALIVWDIKDVL